MYTTTSFVTLPFAIVLSFLSLPLVDAASPANARIVSTSYQGNGCPPGSVSVTLSPDKDLATFGFDSFQATIGPNSKPGDSRKTCDLDLGLDYPDGFQLSVVDTTYHGYVRLDDGVDATFTSEYYFGKGSRGPVTKSNAVISAKTIKKSLRGGSSVIQNAKAVLSAAEADPNAVWSECGKTAQLNVDNILELTSTNPNASGEVTKDDATVKLSQDTTVAWRACTSSGGSKTTTNSGGNGGGSKNGKRGPKMMRI